MAISPHVAKLIELAKAKHLASQLAKASQQGIQSSERRDPVNRCIPEATNVVHVNRSVSNSSDIHQATVVTQQTPMIAAATKMASSLAGLDFNPEQQQAIELSLQGKSICLIGAAGTGKTTVTQHIINQLERSTRTLPIGGNTKWLVKGTPGVVIVGYTNKAVANIKKKLPSHLQTHCMTMHKLIEFAPVYYEIPDPLLGGFKTTMRFEPTYNSVNKLPNISTIIFEESSMIGTDLFGQVIDALANPHAVQMIFLGDLNQLPPVFGPSILGFKLAELPIVELTHVYRQALLSPIIRLATAVRTNGFGGFASTFPEINKTSKLLLPGAPIVVDNGEHGKVTLHCWKKRASADTALTTMKAFLPMQIANGNYNPEEDMILCPFNVSFGTIELNKLLADHIAKTANETVHEVIARYVKSYWAVGDRVMVDRHEAKITDIYPTIGYVGKLPQQASSDLDRWGTNRVTGVKPHEMTADEVLNQLDALGSTSDEENTKNLASHTIVVWIPDLEETRKLTTAGDINNLTLGYVCTVHKSQGSEWRKVFILLHHTHQSMNSRELLYTAITRAKQELYIICEGDIKPYKNQLVLAADRGVIPGTTLREKIAYFADKKASMPQQMA